MNELLYQKYLDKDFLIEFENYNLLMEDFLLKNFIKYHRSIDNNTDLKLLNDKDLLNFSKTFHQEATFYPQSFRTSFFIQMFSVLEYELKIICTTHSKINQKEFSIENLKGNSEIEKAKFYLKKAVNLNLNEIEPEWNYLDTMRKIRNRIVHGDGEINQKHRDWDRIYNFINLNKNLLGFRNSAEYLEKKEFELLYDYNSFFKLDIQNHDFNQQMILNLKQFFNKLILSLLNNEHA
ncbi:hypothetical protein [Flavobacterium ovatum]|uniref:hypothetical protein n=1 Tax=Flavobacterium ovatum TaxID=1928857 RepID=UPI00344E9369